LNVGSPNQLTRRDQMSPEQFHRALDDMVLFAIRERAT
jgi:hypothetical protein